jgi:hypothetical protein
VIRRKIEIDRSQAPHWRLFQRVGNVVEVSVVEAICEGAVVEETVVVVIVVEWRGKAKLK